MRYFIAALDEKHKLLGNFEKILENLEKKYLENCEKCIILVYLLKIKEASLSFFGFTRVDTLHWFDL